MLKKSEHFDCPKLRKFASLQLLSFPMVNIHIKIQFYSRFLVENIGLSNEGIELAGNFRDLFVRILYNHIVQQTSQIPIEQSNPMQIMMRKQSDASLRCSKLLLLISSSLKVIIYLTIHIKVFRQL